MNIERLDTFPSSTNITYPHSIKKNISFKTFDEINNENENNNDNLLNNNKSLEEKLLFQNQNLQNKIVVLTGRINVYENEYLEKTNYLTEQIKNFNVIEMNYKNQIDNQNLKIEQLEKENQELKNQIKEIDLQLKNNKKEDLKNKNNNNKINNIPKLNFNENENNNFESNNQIRDLINLIKEYSKEISKLKQENFDLKSNKNNFSNFNNQNDMNLNSNNDSIIMSISNYVNNEINLINQWIDTYIGDYYDKNYPILSLFSEEINEFNEKNILFSQLKHCLQFDLLKNTLEKSRNKINNYLNQNETNVIEYKILLKQTESRNVELKNELNNLKLELMNINKNRFINEEQINQNKNKKIINKFESNLNQSKDNNEKYLNSLYEMISKELNDTLKDFHFKAFHDKLINNYENFNNLNDKLNDSLDRLIQFNQYLKYDYVKTKEENLNYLNEKASAKFNY